jgi:hypothetical protein
MITYKLRTVWDPNMYHGLTRHKDFFEGWYFKVVDPEEKHAFAFIPGIALGNKEEPGHAFVQVLDGLEITSAYHSFPKSDFHASRKEFDVRIGKNAFRAERIELDLPGIKGSLEFEGLTPWPIKPLSPGIMGWYGFVPRMECYHGVLSLHHKIRGKLEIDGKTIDFTGGTGYTEKDWGTSFPSSWIWIQTNHFSEPEISLSASVARIPWMGSHFIGFIVGFWWKGKLFRFTTYTGAKLEKVAIDPDTVYYTIRDKQFRVELVAHKVEGAPLKSPIKGIMEGRVDESMAARIDLRLFQLNGGKETLIFSDTGRMAGLEVAGNVEELLTSHS